jgi:hypothetical protein
MFSVKVLASRRHLTSRRRLQQQGCPITSMALGRRMSSRCHIPIGRIPLRRGTSIRRHSTVNGSAERWSGTAARGFGRRCKSATRTPMGRRSATSTARTSRADAPRGQAAHPRRGPTDRRQHCQAARLLARRACAQLAYSGQAFRGWLGPSLCIEGRRGMDRVSFPAASFPAAIVRRRNRRLLHPSATPPGRHSLASISNGALRPSCSPATRHGA